MAHQEIIESRVIDAPHDAVWNVITDIRSAAATLSGVQSIEIIDGDEYEVGLRWRETRKVFGMTGTEEMWVAAVDPQRSTRVDAENGGTRYATRFLLDPIGDKTRLVVRFSTSQAADLGIIQKVTGTLFGGLGALATRRMLRSDLADIERAAAGRVNEMAEPVGPWLASDTAP